MQSLSLEEQLLNNALEYHRAGRLSEAEKIYQQVLEIDSENYNALYFLGLLAYQVNQFEMAESYTKKAINLYASPQLFKLMGDILCRREKNNEALEYYNQALSYDPNNSDIYSSIGTCYLYNNHEKAILNYKKAIELGLRTANLYHNLGIAYYLSKQIEESVCCYEEAIKINPCFSDSYNNLASIYHNDVGDPYKAIEYFEKALSLVSEGTPNHTLIMHNLGKAYILTGKDMVKGWQYYEKRTEIFPHHRLKLSPNKCPKWEGQDIKNKFIYVYHAGGIGDTLIFARYLPLIASMGGKIHCQIQPSLEKVFKDSSFNVNVIKSEDSMEDIAPAYQVSFMSLPNAFKSTIETIPFKEGYLKSDPEKVAYYKEKYFNNNEFKLGIVWQSSENVIARSIPDLECFYPFVKLDGVKVYSLQKGSAESQLQNLPQEIEIVDLGSTFSDFSDTSAAVENLDLLITVDTSVTHIAGGLRKPVWVLLHHIADWKWFLDTNKSYWYDSAKLFRQKKNSNWKELLSEVLEEFKDTFKK